MEIIEDGLTIKQGLEREDYYVRKFKEEGWNVLNKMKTGIVSGSALLEISTVIGHTKLVTKKRRNIRHVKSLVTTLPKHVTSQEKMDGLMIMFGCL